MTHGELAVLLLLDVHVGFAEHHEQVAGPGLLQQFVAHRQVGVHPHWQHGQLAVAFGLLRHAGVEGEAADQQHVEAHAADRLLGRLLDELRPDGAVFRADADRGRAGSDPLSPCEILVLLSASVYLRILRIVPWA